jgi:hypothetical protein
MSLEHLVVSGDREILGKQDNGGMVKETGAGCIEGEQ